MAKLTLVKFGSKVCSACLAMDKSKALEKVAEAFPPGSLEIVKLDVADEKGTNRAGTSYDTAYKLSDEYEVSSLPTIILFGEGGGEIDREEGGMSFTQLKKMVANALEASAELAEMKALMVEQAEEERRAKLLG